MTEKLHIAATGCCLMDQLYTQVDFSSPVFGAVRSRTPGDGGVTPGALVFASDFERFAGRPFHEWLEELIGLRPPDAQNLGGPAIVALAHAAQMLDGVRCSFHGAHGDDEAGREMAALIRQAGIDVSSYILMGGESASTVVLSDPDYHSGSGERTFVNTIGASDSYTPEMLNDAFFDADIRLFGATALVPQLHDNLTELLQKGRAHGGLNIVGTVYDFRNEQMSPEQPWPLGDLSLIDLLICDAEEARRISGKQSIELAVEEFLAKGAGAVMVTHGAEAIHLNAQTYPVSEAVNERLKNGAGAKGDTTGCGDNFLGGVLASLAFQWMEGTRENFDLVDALAWGAASGGFACFYPGGLYQESAPGEKRASVQSLYEAYLKQIESQHHLIM